MNLSRSPVSNPALRGIKTTVSAFSGTALSTSSADTFERIGIFGNVNRYIAFLNYVYADYSLNNGSVIIDWTLMDRVRFDA